MQDDELVGKGCTCVRVCCYWELARRLFNVKCTLMTLMSFKFE